MTISVRPREAAQLSHLFEMVCERQPGIGVGEPQVGRFGCLQTVGPFSFF